MARPKDSQQSKVAAALVEFGALVHKVSPISSGVELSKRIDKSAWWTKRSIGLPKGVACPIGNSSSPLVNHLHYRAHALAHREEYALHGPEFCREMLNLTERFLDRNHKQSLALAFGRHHVKTQTWSPEAKERARLKAQGKKPVWLQTNPEKIAQAQEGVLSILRDLRESRTEKK